MTAYFEECFEQTRPMRVLVQHMKDNKGWFYRLIAYDDNRVYLPLRFESIADLVESIRRAMPDFTASRLAVDENAKQSYVVFSVDWELSLGQLYRLGLTAPNARAF